jgi:hypothetical protein
MYRLLTLALFAVGAASLALGSVTVPEIDPATGGSALALLAGTVLVVRARVKK